jgi:tetratricopeptide (TPR) repeat protein
MGLHGDLSTLDLTSLLQNLEGARKTGILKVRDEEEETHLFFDKGQLALISYTGRAGLVDYLVAAGTVAPSAVEQAKKHRRRGQSLSAALVDAGALSAAQLAEIARARLIDDACEVLSTISSTFEFSEVERPSEQFDLDERALAIALAASPLLLESARRSDHWALIREHLPTDSAHFTVARPPRTPGDATKARFQSDVVRWLDGSRSVREVVARFPTRRFEVYQLLSELAKAQSIRPIPTADLNRRILDLARRDKTRALALLDRSLEQNPHHLELLTTKAMLAEKTGEVEQATEALKLVAHLQLEKADHEAALATLKRLATLAKDDPFAWEKRFELALEQGLREDAFAAGRKLIEIHRKPGLHRKVVGVLERLSTLQRPSWELVRELARARAEAGDRDAAVKGLEQFAASQIALEAYALACKAFEEVLAIQPTRARAKQMLQDLQSGAVVRRKTRWRRVRRRALACFVVFVVLPWIGYEALARRAYREAARTMVHERLLESGRFAEARERFAAVGSRYAWSTTALFDVEPLLAELGARNAAPDK